MSGDDAELSYERAYVDWAYERLDEMLRQTEGMSHAAGDVGTYRALRKLQAARREDLLAARNKLVVGRLDYTSPRAEALGQSTLYIGRTHIAGDNSEHHAVIDWRADAAAAFYQATRTQPFGIGRRRTIAMRARAVTGVSDELLTNGFKPPTARPTVLRPPIDGTIETPVTATTKKSRDRVKVGRTDTAPRKARRHLERSAPQGSMAAPGRSSHEPQEVSHDEFEVRAPDLLLEELDRDRTSEMSEVVATIQADQDRLIRASANRPLIIQGGPGTGKTIVGLHRAAYVLYEQRRRGLGASVLVLGPNAAFMQYIGAVLPALGESAARHLALDQLATSNVTVAERSRIRVRNEVTPLAALVLGDERMATVVESAVWSMIRPRKLELGFGRFVLRLSAAEVGEVIATLRKVTTSYREARARLVAGLADAFHENYQSRSGTRIGNAQEELESLATATRRLLAADDRELMPMTEPRTIVMSLLQDRQALRSAGLDGVEVSAVLVPEQIPSRPFPWAREHLALVDEAARLIRGEPERFAHVLVDEAQDLSPMEWRMIARRVQRGSITVLGDLAQAMSVWSTRTWEDVAGRLVGQGKVTFGELRLGYRVPRQVMDFVGPLASLAAPGLAAPVSFRTGKPPELVKVRSDGLCPEAVRIAVSHVSGSTAIVCPREFRARIHDQMSAEQKERVPVLDAEQARGREFDTVCVVEPERIVADAICPVQALYVALTRPTKSLVVVYSLELPDVLGGSSQSLSPIALAHRHAHLAEQLQQALAARGSAESPFPADWRTVEHTESPARDETIGPVAEAARAPGAWAAPQPPSHQTGAEDVGTGHESRDELDAPPRRMRRALRRLFGRGA